jgi:hypothetical protein
MTAATAVIAEDRSSGRRLLYLGLALAAAGIIAYAVQLANHRLVTPWYMPCLATTGAALIARSLWRRRTLWRVIAMLLVTLVAAGEWMFVLGTRLPGYAGPVAAGRAMPDFKSTRASGGSFTHRDLVGDQNHLFVFFRGRW